MPWANTGEATAVRQTPTATLLMTPRNAVENREEIDRRTIKPPQIPEEVEIDSDSNTAATKTIRGSGD